MGVPGFYSWLTRRYPLIKHMLGKKQIPRIDYLYLDMNGIIYKCVKDDSIIFKSQIVPKELEEIWIEIFNYINLIVDLLKPGKMLVMALDGVAPRSKMNNQRARRFKSARDYKEYIDDFYGYSETVDSQENFKNNSISPGTKFMEELNSMLRFFIMKKIEEDEHWRNISIIFTGSDFPGEGEHKIMEFLRANQDQFEPNDNHCLYGADADLIMLGLTLPMKNVMIIREEFIHTFGGVSIIATRQTKVVQFEIIFLTVLREYLAIEYQPLRAEMQGVEFDIKKIINDFVFLFFFIGNDFLPRCMTYNIRKSSIEKLIAAFKCYLVKAQDYVVGKDTLNLQELARLTSQLAKYESVFLEEKTQESQKLLAEKQKFQNEFNEQLKKKVRKETEFLLQMKHLYQNQDGSQRKLFYQTKFKVDPAIQSEQFSKILSSYLSGLHFVYQYYFVNLPSWSWYYRYYYAPLIRDLSYYLSFMATSNQKLEALEVGQPFHPFKQLLCILPKQSAELLPKSFQEELMNPQSALRSPVDFYPDEFQSDMYGSTLDYEAISLIPFLDHDMIDHVYDKAIQKIEPSDQSRNQFGNCELYEYSTLHNEVMVQSPFPHIQSFRCPIAVSSVNLRTEFKWQNMQSNRVKSKLYRMPSILSKQVEATWRQSKRGNVSCILKVTEPDLPQFKMGEQVFYGYPLEHSGEVQAILSVKDFMYVDQFVPGNYADSGDMRKAMSFESLKQHNKRNIFNYLLNCLTSLERYPNLNLDKCENLVFIADTQCFVRGLSGKFMRSFQQNNVKTYEIIPGSFVSKEPLYETTKDVVNFESLEDEFSIGEEVLIISHPKYLGSMARVKGFNKEQNKVKIVISRELKAFKLEALLAIANTDQIFFTLRFASEMVGMRPDILLTMIDSIHVRLPKQKNLPPSIDIGMNFISRRSSQLVPNLVRINYHDYNVRELPEQKVFMKLELSLRAIELLVEYKQNYKEVFEFIKSRHERLIEEAREDGNKINWKENIDVEELFGSEENTVKQLMKVYLWLIKKEETHMPLSSVYSKQISKRKIGRLQDMFRERTNQLNNKKGRKYVEAKEIDIDPNFIFSRKLTSIGLVYLKHMPDQHYVGDGVLCLKRQHFGQYGVIIGIDDEKYEVLFERPSFGKTDLKGLCDNLWGGKFYFRDLFNLATWPKYVERRAVPKRMLDELGWIESHESYFPKFISNPIRNFKDVELLSKQLPEHLNKFIEGIRMRIKPVDVDPEYVVLDNKHEDYYFKYNKNQATIDEKQIKAVKKAIKYVEKPIQPNQLLAGQAGKNFEPEVIENKLVESEVKKQTEEKPEKEVLEIEEGIKKIQIAEEEEDATDIIG